jgi:hypothetical protein
MTSSTQAGTLTIRRPSPAAWKHALKLANGDASRLSVDEDGSVLVANTSASDARLKYTPQQWSIR